jgi:adenine-specific DNA-methyltransferase
LGLERLKELVPQAFSEEKLDIQKLQTLLGEAVYTDNERYQLSWAGKSEAYKVLQMPTIATLTP